jgi:hypothetical protein
MGNLAATYLKQERWKEAEKLFVPVMETRKKIVGQKHPSTFHHGEPRNDVPGPGAMEGC